MQIKRYINRNRRDFNAVYQCEHCGAEEVKSGYDDSYFYQEVIPNMECSECKKKAGKEYKPLATRYPDSSVV